jgi:hypothetical protein
MARETDIPEPSEIGRCCVEAVAGLEVGGLGHNYREQFTQRRSAELVTVVGSNERKDNVDRDEDPVPAFHAKALRKSKLRSFVCSAVSGDPDPISFRPIMWSAGLLIESIANSFRPLK